MKADCLDVLGLPADEEVALSTSSIPAPHVSKFAMIANVKYNFPGIVKGRISFLQHEAST